MAGLGRWLGEFSGGPCQVSALAPEQAEPMLRRLDDDDALCVVDRGENGSIALAGRLHDGDRFAIGVELSQYPHRNAR